MSAEWKFAGASVAGSSHLARGIPCQDYHSARVFISRSGTVTLVIVASDGAGSACMASVGSELACQTVLELLEVHFNEGKSVEDINERAALEWLDAVREAIGVEAADQGLAMRDYACTLLLAVIGPTRAFYLQVGDGAIVVNDHSGDWSWVFWPGRGEFANTTFFVTDETLSQNVMIDSGNAVQEIAIFTDGIEPLVLHYASKTVFAPFFENMFSPVRKSLAAGLDEALSVDLANYLELPAINNRTDDDKTLVLASKVGATVFQE